MNEYNSISPFLLTPLLPQNIIIYKAPNKLPYVTSDYSGGLRINRFGDAKLLKHTFKNGVGILKFNRDVTIIGERAFSGSSITEINLPSSVTKLDAYCLNGCNLTSIDLGDNLKYIGWAALGGNKIDTFIIPDSVTTIDSYAIQLLYSTKIKSIKVGKGLKNVSPHAFYTYLLYDENNPTIVYLDYSAIGIEWLYSDYIKITMGPNVHTISLNAFSGNSRLLSVIIGNTVRTIEDKAFYYCSKLTEINIPNSVKSIGLEAFYNCYGLTKINIPNGVKTLGEGCFLSCYNASSITIGSGITTIPRNCFYQCNRVSSITMSDNITHIGYLGFASCGNSNTIETPLNITISKNIKFIDDFGFNNCWNWVIDDLNLSKIEHIGRAAFAYCDNIKKVTLADSLTFLGESAFYDSDNISEVILSKNLKNISLYSFRNTSIENLIIPEGVEILENYCFLNCTSLETVLLPSTIKEIGNWAFDNCPNINYVEENGLKYLDQDHRCLVSIDLTVTTLNIEANTVSILSETNNFISESSNIQYINVHSDNPIYDSRNNCSAIIKTDTNELILGCGSTIIPSGVTSLGYYAFRNCKTLNTLQIPVTVTSISDSFEGSSLSSIVIPNTVTLISSFCFKNCINLTSVSLSNSITIINLSMFENCSSLTSIVIPEGVTNIWLSAFKNCTNLSSITIPNSVTTIGYDVFDGTAWLNNLPNGPIYINNILVTCKELSENTSLVVNSDTVKISKYAFNNLPNLISLTIPENTSIETYAVHNCPNLTTVTINNNNFISLSFSSLYLKDYFGNLVTKYIIGEGITTIGQYAFYESSNLTEVELPEGLITLSSYCLHYCPSLVNLTIPSTVTSNIRSILNYSTVLNLTINCNIMQTLQSYYSTFGGTIASKLTIGEGVTSIGNYWFYNKSFPTLELPSTITSLGNGAFYNNNSLTNITIKATTPPSIGSSTFNTTSSWINTVTIYVPAASVNTYKNASGWKTYKNRILAIPVE